MEGLKINGLSFDDVFAKYGYTVSYIKRRGNNSGPMLDGSYTDDVVAVKAVVTCVCMPTNKSRLQDLLNVITDTYVTVYYYDPKSGAYREMTAMPSEPAYKFRGNGADLLEYWTGSTIIFTEK